MGKFPCSCGHAGPWLTCILVMIMTLFVTKAPRGQFRIKVFMAVFASRNSTGQDACSLAESEGRIDIVQLLTQRADRP